MQLKNLLPIFFTIIFFNLLSAQEWSEPVQISTMNGSDNEPDLCVDHNGVLHCVWSHKISQNYRKIYYSKSVDQGGTWSAPEDVSQNTSLWMSNPRIATDSENRLYLAYDYNAGSPANMHVLLRKQTQAGWSPPDTVTAGMPGSRFNKLIIDNKKILQLGKIIS